MSDALTTYRESESGNLERIDHSLPKNNPILYTHNASDMVNQMSYAGVSFMYNYDANGQLSSVMKGVEQVAGFTYNVNGLLTDTQLGFGGSIKNSYSSDGTLLQKQSLQTGPATLWDEVQYEYDANRQITKVQDRTGSVEYTYDALNQLTKEHYSNGLVISYTYDSVGNRTSKSVTRHGVTTSTNYGFNLSNQMVSVNGQPISNSIDGNQTIDGRYQYIWNAFDQLTQVKSLTGTVIGTYRYDEQGRRVYSEDSNGTTYYRYDGSSNRVLFEEDALGNITKSYTYDGNGMPLTMTHDGHTYYYLTNYRGDVLALVDAHGNVAAEYSYDAWGNILTQSGHMASINPYRYAGYRYDEQTKLYYLMARYYNPDLGIFLSLDPVRGDTRNPITMNGYNYANNNPVMMVDPNGKAAQIILGAVAGALINAILYYIDKINRYGLKNAHKKIKILEFTITVLAGAAAGALGFGVVKILAKAALLSRVGSLLLSFHIAPAAYLIGSIGNYSAKGLAETQVMSLFGKRTNIIYQLFRPLLQKVINRYRK